MKRDLWYIREIESWDCQNHCHKQKMRPCATRSLSLSLSLCLPSSSLLCLEQSCLLFMCWFEINGLSLTQLIVPWQMWKNTEGKFAITIYTNLSVESWTYEQNLLAFQTEIYDKSGRYTNSSIYFPTLPESRIAHIWQRMIHLPLRIFITQINTIMNKKMNTNYTKP